MPEPADLLPEVERIVREAGRMALAGQPGATHVVKPDGSIVTPTDERIEIFLRQEIAGLLPDAGILGEELASTEEGKDGLWCLDPIDGTSNYAFGSPLFGVSVGLVRGEEALLGVIFLPALGEMYLAARGFGATLNGRMLPAIPPGPVLPQELVSYPDRILKMYPETKLPGKMRHTGAFVVDAVFTAAQRFRGLLGVREKLYDIAAALCIAGEVDADIRYADGRPLLIEPLKRDHARLESRWVIFPRSSGLDI